MQRVTHIGIISLAKIMGMSGVLFGLLVSIPYGLIVMMLGAAGGAAAEGNGFGFAALGIGGGLFVMAVLPLIYGALLFIIGLIQGLILNLVLHLGGGLELRIEAPRQMQPMK